jgi:hypothetical protein
MEMLRSLGVSYVNIVHIKYLNKTIIFKLGTGCIPAGSWCYCHTVIGDYAYVTFQNPILGSTDLKVHINVINEHGTIT